MLEKVPACLKDLPQWVLWRTIVRDGMPTKLPFQVNGAAAKSNDPKTWSAFPEAVVASKRGDYSGLGFVFSESDEFCGIDLDGCRNPESGEYADWAKAILSRLNSYSEMSPSETGVKTFVIGKSPWGSGKKFPVADAPVICDKQPSIEVYDKLRYFAVTGLRIGNLPHAVEPRQEALQWLADAWGPKTPAPPVKVDWSGDSAVTERARAYLAKMPVSIAGQGGHSAALYAARILVVDFGLPERDALGLLREWNAGCQPPWDERDLARKISEAMKLPGERNKLRNAQREWRDDGQRESSQRDNAGRNDQKPTANRLRDICDLAKGLDRSSLTAAIRALLHELEIQNLGS